MKKDDSVYLHHILDAINRIEEYLAGVTRETFLENHMQQDAVVRQIEIIGEAARNVSPEFRDANADLPWSSMVGMRNKIIHDYFDVNFDVVWETVMNDLPPLKSQVVDLLGED